MSSPRVSYMNLNDRMDDIRTWRLGEILFYAVLLVWLGLLGFGTLVYATKLGNQSDMNSQEEEGLHEGLNNSATIRITDYEEDMKKDLGTDVVQLAKKKRICLPFAALSCSRNGAKLFKKSESHTTDPDRVTEAQKVTQLFDGMKFYAFLWLMLGMTYLFALTFVISNTKDFNKLYQNFIFTLVPTSYFAVDALLFLSGLIATYNLLLRDSFGLKDIPSFWVGRYLRLVPMVVIVMTVAYFALGRVVVGPMSQLFNESLAGCATYWWTNFVMINNFYPKGMEGTCMWWTWYISLDF